MTKQEINETMDSLKERFEYGAYCEACEQFAQETAERHYVMRQDGTWAETCDNAHGGPSVAWAFHETFSSVDDLNDRCTAHYDAWLDENYQAMLADCED